VLELSELQLPTIDRGADLALYTNVGEDHLDRHGTVEAYRAVKARLAELTAPAGRVVLNADDPGCRELGERLPTDALAWYGATRPGRGSIEAWVDAEGWIVVAGERLLPAAEVPLPGRHMRANVVGAALASHIAGAALPAVAAATRAFRGVPHRLETVAERGGVRWVNDSQATIPVAAIAALEAFDAPIVLIAGGKDKGLDYAALADEIARRCRAAVLIGETAEAIQRLVRGRVPVERAASMADAVALAAAIARAGDVVLLAPASASFDMFVDYAARGDAFRDAVMSA
jgi:UDP-N-acetylmuramoylalanine--D-glutamate ligase